MTRLRITRGAAGLVVLFALTSASPGRMPGAPFDSPRSMPSPAATGSAQPYLAVSPAGTVWMSWLELRPSGGHALRAARLDGARWRAPVTIAEGDSFFANWADFPTLLPLGEDRLVAHYLWKTGAATYAYEVRITQSADGGATWSAPVVPHRDGTPTEHGFVSLLPAEGGARAVWLDGRHTARDSAGHWLPMPEGTGEMTLRTGVLDEDGRLSMEAELDPRVCECCQTAAVPTPGGALVAFRDRSAGEVRDIFLARLEGDRWSEPYALHADGWKISGCPVNGPALAAAGDRVAAAWFTQAGDTARVLVALSEDGGRTFGAPVRVDGGDPLGRVHVLLLADGDALVSWLEARGKEAWFQVRRVTREGTVGPESTVTRMSSTRGSGFPQMARTKDRVVLAWTEAGKPPQVRTAVARVGR